jgi:hypothetical protein
MARIRDALKAQGEWCDAYEVTLPLVGQQYDRARQAVKTFCEEDLLLTDADGSLHYHPALDVVAGCVRELKEILADFNVQELPVGSGDLSGALFGDAFDNLDQDSEE